VHIAVLSFANAVLADASLLTSENNPVGRAFFGLQLADIWVVLLAVAGFQLSLQLLRPAGKRVPEGAPKTLQLLTGIPALAVLVIFMFDPDLGEFASTPLGAAINIAGFMAFNAAGFIIWSCHRTLGALWSGELETQPGHRLIDAGPYRLVRHPLYASYFLASFGLFAMGGGWLLGVMALAYCLALAARIPREEAMMVQCLGETYTAYRKTTGLLLPRLGRVAASERSLVERHHR